MYTAYGTHFSFYRVTLDINYVHFKQTDNTNKYGFHMVKQYKQNNKCHHEK